MKFLIIKTSILKNTLIIITSLFFSGLFLIFGITNLINPDVPQEFLNQNTIVCIVYCGIGLLFLLFAIAAFRGVIYSKKN